ncbi:hypothetical protein [Prosthecobacter sp.]|uniref:hypothetical protein n=1 Tax=Prosthecobacter sp. TaxID=1965333 RepID=UPI002ABBB1B3|nr:hypothetical protein [Prosthecobacter sp.]MDZ4404353.1 hypothetical protein [Prosthecobacter sp.]
MTAHQEGWPHRSVEVGLEALAGMPKGGAMVAEIVAKASLKSSGMQEMAVLPRNFQIQCIE